MEPAHRVGTADGWLDDGRSALAAGAWEHARQAFAKALEEAESAEGWEGLSWAAWWLDDAATCLHARERAYRLHRAAGDLRGAARMALWLGDDYEVFRGDAAVANGWVRRAERLLDDLQPGPEHARMAGFHAYSALEAGDTATAKRLSAEVQELGRAHGATDFELLGLAIEGMALVDEGAVEQGMSRLDEAATGALSGECEELSGVAYTCCLVVSACDRVRDIDRAAQWCRRVEEFSGRLGVRFVHGSCRAYYASILVWKGDWAAAERELEAAAAELADGRPAWHDVAVVRLAELRRRQGRFSEAEELFSQAEFDLLSRQGLAEIRLERRDLDAARGLLERALRSIPPQQADARARPLDRVRPLELLARVEAAAGNLDAAGRWLAELRGLVAPVPIEWPRAVASFAEGLVAAAAADHEAARQHLEDSVELFSASSAPFETSRARVELAGVLLELGRPEAAAREATAAARRLDELGAAVERSRAERLLGRIGGRAKGGPSLRGAPLTARQVEVLNLIAEGSSDREIAAELVLSEHTVHRHVANILTRLDRSSRSAAVAEAARLGLLDAGE